MRPRGENIEYDKLRDRYEALAAEIAFERKTTTLQREECITWMNRVKALEAALEVISNGEGAGGLAETERLQEIARAALTAPETPIAQSKSQQKRFEAHVPFAEETKVMHDKCEHGKGLGDHCEPCGDDDDTHTA